MIVILLMIETSNVTFFINRFLLTNKYKKVNYIDILQHIFLKLSIFNIEKIYNVEDYYNGFLLLHSFKGINIFRYFDGINYSISYGNTNDVYISELYHDITDIDICNYILDNDLYDNCLFDTRFNFISWCNIIHLKYEKEEIYWEKYSVFVKRDNTMSLDNIEDTQLKILVQGIKENRMLIEENLCSINNKNKKLQIENNRILCLLISIIFVYMSIFLYKKIDL